ncbi:alpha/beta fold hydrolase [Egicoccus halophilus]|uniref:Esterase n=1 Tax=Egicoccus halophilus TaxID=1670830 RepID=A0A8J3EVB9_9ACTN|nr:alpha/beta hydrolase [Egicoccus halophilus]GGI09379.1 esterase [Egicoccus halophilus]
MTHFVLVAGSWGGGWIWQPVRQRLEAAGHRVETPTLPGLGERHHLATPGTGLTDHVEDLVDLLDRTDAADVVLVGHSYGGMVVTGAAAARPERIRQVVYLDAFVPEAGQSAFDLQPWLRDAFAAAALPERPWLVAPLDFAALGVEDPDALELLARRSTPLPLRTHEEPSAVSAPDAASGIRRSYLHCTAAPFFADTAAAVAADGFEVTTIDAGHMALVTHPDLVAQALSTAVQEPAAAPA